MKKFTLLLVMMLAYAGFTMAQTVENFESIKMEMFAQGANSSISVIPNPDTVSNHSLYCGKYVIGVTGRDPWAGWSNDFPNDSVDVNVTQYAHIKIWKSFTSRVDLKLEHGPGNTQTNDLWPMSDPTNHSNTLTSHWEELVFDLKSGADAIKTGKFSRFTLIPDFPAVNPTTVNTIYFDNIYFNNDPAVGSAPIRVLENWEVIPMHPYGELGTFTLIDNPDKSGNLSDHVIDFMRPVDAPDWAGFFSALAASGYDSVDVTTNKFVHVKVWKPRLSVVKFKLEGGAAGNLEIASMYPQTKTNAWEDMVFDFRSKTGKYPTIGFSLDAGADVLTDPIHIYFDDIVVTNDSNAMVSLTLNVDMHGAGLKTADKVYVAGGFGGWVSPGSNPTLQMMDANADSIYSITLIVPPGAQAFKFFINAGWDGGEWNGDPNRTLSLMGDTIASYIWGDKTTMVKVRENPLAGKIQMYPNPVSDVLNVNTTADVRRVIITNTVGKVVGNMVYTNNRTINTSDLSRGMYFVTFIGKDGSKVTQKLIKN